MQVIKNTLATSFLILLSVVTIIQAIPIPCKHCPLELEWVCGVDGENYENNCTAECFKVEVASIGMCPGNGTSNNPVCPIQFDSCACPLNLDEVCGWDGKTYPNCCAAQCAGASAMRKGRCEDKPEDPCPEEFPKCQCPKILKEVCGSNGLTFNNCCEAQCKNVAVVREGPCILTRH